MATRRKRSQRRRAASACPRKAGRSVQPGWVGPDRKEITEPSPPARARPEGAAFVSATSLRTSDWSFPQKEQRVCRRRSLRLSTTRVYDHLGARHGGASVTLERLNRVAQYGIAHRLIG